jgi:hypothetical protein
MRINFKISEIAWESISESISESNIESNSESKTESKLETESLPEQKLESEPLEINLNSSETKIENDMLLVYKDIESIQSNLSPEEIIQ